MKDTNLVLWVPLAMLAGFGLFGLAAPRRIADSHYRWWRSLGARPAEPDAFVIALYRIVSALALTFAAILTIYKIISE